MGFEIIKYLQATPNRVFDALKLIEVLGEVEIKLLYELLQPELISKGQGAINPIRNILLHFNLATTNTSKTKLSLTETNYLDSYDMFRLKMQQVMLGAKEDHEDNFLLSQVTAWYAAKNHEVVTLDRVEFERQFHLNLYPSIASDGSKTRKISERDSIFAWGLWARFLGFGKEYAPDTASGRRLMPNAKGRILPLLSEILSPEETIPINEFIERLSLYCPELDGGIVYEKCYQAVHGQSAKNAPLCLMLSTALYQLKAEKVISIIDEPDAKRTRKLFPSVTYDNQISHIRFHPAEVSS